MTDKEKLINCFKEIGIEFEENNEWICWDEINFVENGKIVFVFTFSKDGKFYGMSQEKEG
jgi:hypothetical protein